MIDSSFEYSGSAIWFHPSTKSGLYRIFCTFECSGRTVVSYLFFRKKDPAGTPRNSKIRCTLPPSSSSLQQQTWRERKTSTRSYVAQRCSDGAARGLEKISLHLKAVIGTNQLCGQCVAVADARAHTRAHSRAQTEQEWHKQFPVFQTWSVDVRWWTTARIRLHSLAWFSIFFIACCRHRSLLPAVNTCATTCRGVWLQNSNRWHAYFHMNITDRVALISSRRTCLANEKTRYAELFVRWCSRQ